ncbi:MAG: STAS domain-containing protein [Streptomyces sp.]
MSGQVRHLTAARLDDVLLAAVLSGARCVEVDFSRAGFCDRAGLNVLLGARSHCRDEGVRFACPGRSHPPCSGCCSYGRSTTAAGDGCLARRRNRRRPGPPV